LNASQGLGYRPLNPAEVGVDALTSCGFKWLCGPYGTGFCWIAPELRDSMKHTQAYWLANLGAGGLEGEFGEEIRPDLGARAYDVFGTANFMNYMPWIRSVEYLLELGITRIAAHNDALVSRLIDGVDRDWFEFLSPTHVPARTAIAVLQPRNNNSARRLVEMLARRRLDVSLRQGRLRVSPHVHNTEQDIDLLLDALHDFGRSRLARRERV
jgi:selenocysteine lyase/cysteine desulfurase